MSIYGKFMSAAAAAAILGCAAAYGAKGTEPYDGDKYFILREYGNTLALFEDGAEEPLAVYSTPISQVNSADAALLAEGIRLKSMSEVARLLEDLDVE